MSSNSTSQCPWCYQVHPPGQCPPPTSQPSNSLYGNQGQSEMPAPPPYQSYGQSQSQAPPPPHQSYGQSQSQAPQYQSTWYPQAPQHPQWSGGNPNPNPPPQQWSGNNPSQYSQQAQWSSYGNNPPPNPYPNPPSTSNQQVTGQWAQQPQQQAYGTEYRPHTRQPPRQDSVNWQQSNVRYSEAATDVATLQRQARAVYDRTRPAAQPPNAYAPIEAQSSGFSQMSARDREIQALTSRLAQIRAEETEPPRPPPPPPVDHELEALRNEVAQAEARRAESSTIPIPVPAAVPQSVPAQEPPTPVTQAQQLPTVAAPAAPAAPAPPRQPTMQPPTGPTPVVPSAQPLPQSGLSFARALRRPPVRTKPRMTDEERRTRIRAYLVERVIPYARASNIAGRIAEEYGPDLLRQASEDVFIQLPMQQTYAAGYRKHGHVRPSEFSLTSGHLLSCKKCSASHPTDTCGKMYQVYSIITNRDPGWYCDLTETEIPSDELPCSICRCEGRNRAAEHHYSLQHGREGYYEHPGCPNLFDIVKDAEEPDEVLLIIPDLIDWPERLQKKPPLPLYCFFPSAFQKPDNCPPIRKALTFGLRNPDQSVPEAIQEQIDREAKKDSRKGSSHRAETRTPNSAGSAPSSSAGPSRGHTQVQTSQQATGFGKAQVHPALPRAGVTSDNIYVVSALFMQAVKPMFIKEHKFQITRLHEYTQHLHSWLSHVYVEDKGVADKLSAMNRLLWNQLLKPYAEAWGPSSSALHATKAAELKDSFPKLVGLSETFPSAWEVATEAELDVDVWNSVNKEFLTPNPDKPTDNPPVSSSDDPNDEPATEDTEAQPIAEDADCEFFFDPWVASNDKYEASEPKTDKEAALQLDHFRNEYARHVTSDLIPQFSDVVKDGRQLIRKHVTKHAPSNSSLRDHLKERLENMKALGHDCIAEHLEFKEELPKTNENALEVVKALQTKLDKFWADYRAKVKEHKEALESFPGIQSVFSGSARQDLWPILVGSLLPCEHPAKRPLRQMTVSNTMKYSEEDTEWG